MKKININKTRSKLKVIEGLDSLTRLAAYELLVKNKGLYVAQLLKALNIKPLENSPTNLSHHLTKLEKAGLIKRDRVGKSVFCTAIPRPVTELLASL